jgi:hypothetical protein
MTYDTKILNHNINNEINEVQHKRKRFIWNFELNFKKLEIIKIHPKWLPQHIALVFIQKYPYLGLNTSQIKRHFKHLKFTSQENNDHQIHFFQPKNQKSLKIS